MWTSMCKRSSIAGSNETNTTGRYHSCGQQHPYGVARSMKWRQASCMLGASDCERADLGSCMFASRSYIYSKGVVSNVDLHNTCICTCGTKQDRFTLASVVRSEMIIWIWLWKNLSQRVIQLGTHLHVSFCTWQQQSCSFHTDML